MQKLSLDVKKTKALLVGVSEYKSLDPIIPALGNIEDLMQLLTDEQLFGLPIANIKLIPNKTHEEIYEEIIEFLEDESNADFETLLFYYVGHGIRESAANKELYLTGTNTKVKTLKMTAIPYNSIKTHIENSHWQQRIVILDACHSGLATMGDEKHFTEAEMDIQGTYVLASAAGDEKSFFDPTERHTFFSGELIKLLRGGLPKHQPCLSLDDIFLHLEKNLKQSTPKKKSNLNAHDFFFFRNLQYDKAAMLIREALQLFEVGQYEEAIKQYEKVLVELIRPKNRDLERIEKINRDIEIAELYLEVKNKITPDIEKAFAVKTSELQQRIQQLEAAKSELETQLKTTVSAASYKALQTQKAEIEKALSKGKQDLQKTLAQIATLEQANKQLRGELKSVRHDLAKEKEALEKALQDLKNAAKPQNYMEKTAHVAAEMIFIKGGLFQMGSNENDSEKPIHQVTLTDFYIGKYLVTVAEFERFIEATGHQTDADKDSGSTVSVGGKWEKQSGVNWRCGINGRLLARSDYNYPVIHVSWNDAIAYCDWLSRQTGKTYSLPTEAQWEYAAGGGSNNRTKWAGTDQEKELVKYAWFEKNSGKKLHPVGELAANQLGLHDMSGNVWEWCNDWCETYSPATVTNPKGPEKGSDRVLRGGGWYNSAGICRVAFRASAGPDDRYDYLGFRLVFVP